MKKFDIKLTRRNLIFIVIGAAGFLIIALLIFLTTWRVVSNKILTKAEPSRVDTSKPAEVKIDSLPIEIFAVEEGQITEGFESGVVPPEGWILASSNITYTWEIGTAGTPYSGTHFAQVLYAPGLIDQDEFLLSPTFWGDSGSVSFWSGGSVYWCKIDYDNCDLEVWFIGPQPGPGDDTLLGKGDDSWTADWVWGQSTFDFSPYLNGVGRIGFRYVGNDGAQVKLDHIIITYSGDVPTFLPTIMNLNTLIE